MQIPASSVGVTQMSGLRPKQTIRVQGIDWQLRRDATDAAMEFPHLKVVWLNTGSEPIMEGRAHCCWIMGVVPPTAGSIQLPLSVMYIGFHLNKVVMNPNSLSQADLDRMHVYVSSAESMVDSFISQFLGLEPQAPIAERETIAPWPPTIDMPEPLDEKPVSRPLEVKSAILTQ